MSIGGETITLRRAALVTETRHNTQRRDWTAATDTAVTGCSVQPYAAAENTADREFTTTHLRLFAPYACGLTATDRVVHQGVVYEVDGDPAQWRDDNGTPNHLEATIKRLAG